MEKSLRSFSGLPVLMAGRRIGRVAQASLCEDLRRLEGVWIDAGLCPSRFISAESIEVLGEVSVTVDAPGQRCKLREKALFRRVVSTDGVRLGAVVDAVVDTVTFQVCGLIVSTGIWDDLARGRRMIRRFAPSPDGGVIADLQPGEEDHNEERHD